MDGRLQDARSNAPGVRTLGARPALRCPRRGRRAPAGPPAHAAGRQPCLALLVGPWGRRGLDPSDHRRGPRRRRGASRLAHGRRRASAFHGRATPAIRLREDGRPRGPRFRAGHGPRARASRVARARRRWPRPIRDQADLRRTNAVEGDVFPTTTWDERDTRAYLQGPSKLEGRGVRKPPAPDDAPIVLR